MKISSEYFKKIMSHFISGVTIISTKDHEGKFFGLTASSFASLSLDPPLILFCLSSSSKSLLPIETSKTFAVSILSEDQADISDHFAKHKIDKFTDIDYDLGSFSSCPLITGANCWIECSLYANYDGGDHRIIVGKVENLITGAEKGPLAYYNRDYRKIL